MPTVSRADRRLLTTMAAGVGLALLLLGVLTLVGVGGDAAQGGDIEPDLLAQLQDGGEVLLMRHALTDTTQVDADPTARGSCAQQRNLSAEGQAQARRIAQGMRDAGLPLGPVFASPYCRTVDTARPIAGDAEPVAAEALISVTAAGSVEESARITEEAAQLIMDQLGGDDVAVAVTHTQTIEALTGLLVEEGEAVVLTTRADGDVEVLGTIPAEDW